MPRLTKEPPFRRLSHMASITVRTRKTALIVRVVAVVTFIVAVLVGVAAGLSIAETVNVRNQENFVELAPALPTKILDINGDLITEFSAEEKRELISIDELPRHLIYAFLAREDDTFYKHHGFTLKSIMRAVFGKIIGRNLGGGSTITQQLAGTLYADRSDYSITRKLRELWWAFQLERRYTKNEILELYLNKVYMGAGTFGVEAASKYYFGHSAREITLAESAILAIQLSSPARYNPLDNPNVARDRQQSVLDRMVELGYTTREEADKSFAEYWDNYDYTRASSSAYFARDDKAPWFSEYARRQLNDMLYGSLDLYKDGFVVHTTLDLNFQAEADKYMARDLAYANTEFKRSQGARLDKAEEVYVPIVDLLSLTFDLENVHESSDSRTEEKSLSRFIKRVNPIVDMTALLFNQSSLKTVTNGAYAKLKTVAEKNTIEGALICLENETGYVKALIGGSSYSQSNQLIRATQSHVMPGSSFKPLYYSAAIDSRKFTAASLIYDAPVVFFNEDGTPYIPLDFKGEWKGPVLLWYALAHSMNVPSLKILDSIGFDAAINRAAALLGIEDKEEIRETFPRVYPLGLGVIGIAPIQMARAFAIFANQGREVTPIAIRAVEDRNGRIIMDPEKELRLQQKRKGASIQVISQQNAYVMTTILENTVQSGTLAYASGYGSKFVFKDKDGKKYTIPAAGKTGTSQNWGDAWAVGYTPYYTTAIWFGFDRPGNSLGVNLTGATIAGPAWANFMRAIHQGLPQKDFVRPATGLIDVTVCARSGLLPTPNCDEGTRTFTFLEGTQPTRYCDIHEDAAEKMIRTMDVMRPDTYVIDESDLSDRLKMPELHFDLLPDGSGTKTPTQPAEPAQSSPTPAPTGQSSDYNPLLD